MISLKMDSFANACPRLLKVHIGCVQLPRIHPTLPQFIPCPSTLFGGYIQARLLGAGILQECDCRANFPRDWFGKNFPQLSFSTVNLMGQLDRTLETIGPHLLGQTIARKCLPFTL
jgi:hypothetical protein